ncbi:hypothetical protein RN001_001597 [Aquatica leii]|uniref:RNA helicase n=1 Tax=Aquatica leii TaxID=1421715 RepID=A0AAN7PLD3_9COLE|nr:hypothetical protein RN001_001597 [Aquatica leii]
MENFPLGNIQDLHATENKLRTGKNYKSQLNAHFKKVGGYKPDELVKILLKKTVSNMLASKFSCTDGRCHALFATIYLIPLIPFNLNLRRNIAGKICRIKIHNLLVTWMMIGMNQQPTHFLRKNSILLRTEGERHSSFANKGRGGGFHKSDGFDNVFESNGNDDGGWGDSESRPRRGGRGGGMRGGRGRGGRGGARGGGGHGGDGDSWGNNRDSDDTWGGGNKEDGWGDGDNDGNGNSHERGRGRGGRGGRGRGGRGGGSGDGGKRDENEENGEPPKREIYVPPEPTMDEDELFNSGISSGINFIKYDDIEVRVSGENIPKAISSFETSGLRPLLLDNIKKSGYTKPTPIQKNAIPIVMSGRDVMACAQTGSGKTAAFLLPIIHCLLAEPSELIYDGECSQPQAIIVSPTRELCIQIFEEARKFSFNSAIKVAKAYGGTSVGYQRKHVSDGCHILVATPGRMHDFVKRGSISFASTRFVVLDEADRMLDMGFLSSMEEMLSHTTMVPTGDRRTLMFSATFPEEIQHLASKFLDNYIFVAIGIVGSACSDVEQVFHQVDKFKKRNKLVEILQEGSDRTLVFVETKRNADFLATYLSENDFQTTSIHGDRLQREREQALADFKRGSRNILVATAVAARGLDIKNVKHVINYDLPKSIDEYVHRIGRTGRVGNRGKATSFYDESQDGAIAGDLSRILKQAGQPVPDWLGRGGGGSYSSSAFGGKDVRADDFAQSKPVEVDEEEW